MHAGAEHRLAGLRERMSRLAERDREAGETLRQLAGDLDAARAELLRFARGVHPRSLTERPRQGPQRAGRAGHCSGQARGAAGRFPPAQRGDAFFLCSEGLANVAKYAEGASADIAVRATASELVVHVADDGAGAPTWRAARGCAGWPTGSKGAPAAHCAWTAARCRRGWRRCFRSRLRGHDRSRPRRIVAALGRPVAGAPLRSRGPVRRGRDGDRRHSRQPSRYCTRGRLRRAARRRACCRRSAGGGGARGAGVEAETRFTGPLAAAGIGWLLSNGTVPAPVPRSPRGSCCTRSGRPCLPGPRCAGERASARATGSGALDRRLCDEPGDARAGLRHGLRPTRAGMPRLPGQSPPHDERCRPLARARAAQPGTQRYLDGCLRGARLRAAGTDLPGGQARRRACAGACRRRAWCSSVRPPSTAASAASFPTIPRTARCGWARLPRSRSWPPGSSGSA